MRFVAAALEFATRMGLMDIINCLFSYFNANNSYSEYERDLLFTKLYCNFKRAYSLQKDPRTEELGNRAIPFMRKSITYKNNKKIKFDISQ